MSDYEPVPVSALDPSSLTLSHGAVRSLQACPRRWRLRRTRSNGQPAYPPTPAERWRNQHGLVVHEVLRTTLEMLAGRPFDLGEARRAIRRALAPATRAVLDDVEANWRVPAAVASHMRVLAFRMAEQSRVEAAAFRALLNADLTGAVVGARGAGSAPYIESEVKVAANLAGLAFEGRIDLVVVDGDQVRICDFKTGGLGPGQTEEEFAKECEHQLHLYAALWKANYGGESFFLEVIRAGSSVKVAEICGVEVDRWVTETSAQWGAARDAAMRDEARQGARCVDCAARAGCAEYWRQVGDPGRPESRWVDAHVRITGPRGSDRMFPAKILSSSITEVSPGTLAWFASEEDLAEHEERLLLGVTVVRDSNTLTLAHALPTERSGFRGSEVWSASAR